MARQIRNARPPGRPLPKNGKVIFQGKLYYIASVRHHPDGAHTYTLYPLEHVARTLQNITLDQITNELEKVARYKIGDKVVIGYSSQMSILKRQWDLRTGRVWYHVADPRRNVGAGWLDQQTIMKHDHDIIP